MALESTKYHDGVKFKVVTDQAITTSAIAINASGGPGKLFSITASNLKSANTAVYVKVYFTAAPILGTTYPDLIFPVLGGASQTLQIPYGYDYTELGFSCTLNATPLDTTNPSASTAVTLTCS